MTGASRAVTIHEPASRTQAIDNSSFRRIAAGEALIVSSRGQVALLAGMRRHLGIAPAAPIPSACLANSEQYGVAALDDFTVKPGGQLRRAWAYDWFPPISHGSIAWQRNR